MYSKIPEDIGGLEAAATDRTHCSGSGESAGLFPGVRLHNSFNFRRGGVYAAMYSKIPEDIGGLEAAATDRMLCLPSILSAAPASYTFTSPARIRR